MTTLFRGRLAVCLTLVVGEGLAIWNAGTLRAQVVPQPPMTPEEVSNEFVGELIGIAKAMRRYHSDIYFAFGKESAISAKSRNSLKTLAAVLWQNMATQIEEPHFKASISSANGKTAQVKVERDEISHPHIILLIREAGNWKVDLLATYANWNKITEAQALKRVEGFRTAFSPVGAPFSPFGAPFSPFGAPSSKLPTE